MTGQYLRGAFVEFMPTFLIPLPNIILFQYNPDTMTHGWQPPAAAEAGTATGNPLAVKGVPGESFSFTLTMDSNDTLSDGSVVTQALAEISGVYPRLAALEMLLYPTGAFGGGLLGTVSAGLSGASADSDKAVPESQVPTVLFVWGPGRILPVRVTGLSITEKYYDSTLLNPIRADAQVDLQVLTPEELAVVTGPLATIAQGAYTFNQGLRQALALANLANSVESVIGMLPI